MGQYRVRGPTGNCNGRSGALLQWQKLWRHPDPLCRSGCHRQQRHLRPLVNLERETVFRRFLKHLHLLCLRTSYSLAQFLYAPVFYKGKIVAGRKSPNSLYDPKIATMEGEAPAYDQSDATGFIRLNAFRLKIRAALKKVRDRK